MKSVIVKFIIPILPALRPVVFDVAHPAVAAFKHVARVDETVTFARWR